MASGSATLYVGYTQNLEQRILEHKQGKIEGFTKKYECKKLIYFEELQYVNEALDREIQIKKWNRKKKEDLIKTLNPQWKDLAENWYKLDWLAEGSLRQVRDGKMVWSFQKIKYD